MLLKSSPGRWTQPEPCTHLLVSGAPAFPFHMTIRIQEEKISNLIPALVDTGVPPDLAVTPQLLRVPTCRPQLPPRELPSAKHTAPAEVSSLPGGCKARTPYLMACGLRKAIAAQIWAH